MANVLEFLGWLERDCSRFSPLEDHVTTKRPTPMTVRIHLYTDINSYILLATENDAGGHLVCSSESRKPRAGESWHRGHTLFDGPLNDDSWHKVLGLIVSYEMVRVYRKKSPYPAGEQK